MDSEGKWLSSEGGNLICDAYGAKLTRRLLVVVFGSVGASIVVQEWPPSCSISSIGIAESFCIKQIQIRSFKGWKGVFWGESRSVRWLGICGEAVRDWQ